MEEVPAIDRRDGAKGWGAAGCIDGRESKMWSSVRLVVSGQFAPSAVRAVTLEPASPIHLLAIDVLCM